MERRESFFSTAFGMCKLLVLQGHTMPKIPLYRAHRTPIVHGVSGTVEITVEIKEAARNLPDKFRRRGDLSVHSSRLRCRQYPSCSSI